jgi:predicted DNA-binding transcriptional regulator YafY
MTRERPRVRAAGLIRLLKMERQLRTQGATVPQLMQTFGVCRRTVWRDLRVLEAAGVRVRCIEGPPKEPQLYVVDEQA